MAKYIIDIPDEHEFDWVNKSSRLGFELCFPINEAATNINYYIPTGLKLESYTEPDREAIEDEVWEFARRIICPSDCCEDSISAYTKEIFNKEGWEIRGIFNDLSYQEAKAQYDAWKKERDEESQIRVGDEVQYSLSGYEYTFIVFGKENDTLYGIRSDCGDGLADVYDGWETCDRLDRTLVKTGRHFDEVEKLLKKIEED